MITGCNTNIRHRDLVFHVQTEDSGRANPHIISHVYYGGTIVGSRKQDYADAVELPDLDREVRSRIEAQHKAMLKALRRGEFDAAIDERLGPIEGIQAAPEAAPNLSVAAEPGDSTTGQVTGSSSVAGSTASAAAGSTTDSSTHSTTSSTTAGNATSPQIEPEPSSLRERPAAMEKVASQSVNSVFGEKVDSQKPLDEVILEYLVEKAQERSSDRRPPPKTRSKG